MFVRSGNAWVQQGPKLVGRRATADGFGGTSVALSSNGNTALIGAPGEHDDIGGAWVFVRSGSTWTQQGRELVGSGIAPDTFAVSQGSSVALSADGNTALVGGSGDGADRQGATWVFVRSRKSWSQQGRKLVGSDQVGLTGEIHGQGTSVALSADGNTALIGAPNDNRVMGAAWVFVRSGNTWSQQGPKLVGSGAATGQYGFVDQGSSVALSRDGNTALMGADGDANSRGAAWVFVRRGGTWSQQGPKLVGRGAVRFSAQGESVALSGNGNTALIGGPNYRGSRGAVWVFTRRRGSWSQEGRKLIGTGAEHPDLANNPGQGSSVALSGTGNTALIGGPNDNHDDGAAWVFVRTGGRTHRPPPTCPDPDHDSDSDAPR